jgi:predicted carbohydrate-binding protein with CBM5 and CBM33 domain
VKLRRRLAVLGTALVAGIGAILVAFAQPASAHGVAMFPGARTYECYVDGLQPTGQIAPSNPACADAVAQGGQQPLYDWFGVLRSDAGGRTTGYIPDGQICGGGTTKYAAYNAARADWPITHLTSGSTVQVRYSNWAAHPGTFHMYLTKQGWDPTTPLAWADLEPFWSATDPPQTGPPGSLNYYHWDTTFPSGRSGQAIMFIQWVRSDSQENFFSCSDITFDGGHGEVTGIGGQPSSSPTSPGHPTVGGTVSDVPSTHSPSPSRVVSASPSRSGSTGCTATWQNRSVNWAGHFQAQVTVTNAGNAAVNGWTVKWAFAGGQTFEGAPWNGTLTAQPPNVAVTNVDWNKVIAPGGSTSFGFNGAGTTPDPAPVLTCTSP